MKLISGQLIIFCAVCLKTLSDCPLCHIKDSATFKMPPAAVDSVSENSSIPYRAPGGWATNRFLAT